MRTLSERDAATLLRFVRELDALDEPLAFPPPLLAALHKLVPSDEIGYSELDPSVETSLLQVWHLPDGEDEVVVGPSAVSELWWQVRRTHPVCGYRVATGDWTTPYKTSDFRTLREFRRTPIYDAFYRDFVNYWLDVGLPAIAKRTRVFIFTRNGRTDFDERDKLILELLQPHLAARADAVAAAAAATVALAEVEHGAGDETSRVVLCSAGGVIEFASPAARALLARYAAVANGLLPEQLLARREVVLAADTRRLHVRIARTGNLHVLVLDERDVRVERLTERERQIVDLVARGKSNGEIASALGIAPGTVAKHLENTYRKLGVQNRTSAAALLGR